MRRILVASCIAILMGGGSAFSFATAADEAQTNEWMGIPDFQDNETLVYVTEKGENRTYTVQAGPIFRGADGLDHPGRWVNGGRLLDENMRFLAGPSGTGTTRSGTGQNMVQSATTRTQLAGYDATLCGFSTSIRDEGTIPATIYAGGNCVADGGLMKMSLTSQGTFKGRPTATYLGTNPFGEVQLTYASGIPGPISMASPNTRNMTLIAWQPGDGALERATQGTTMPDAIVKPTNQFGPTGIDGILALDLPSRVELAASSAEDPAVALFMRDHPDWRIVEATGRERAGDNWRVVSWTFKMQEGVDAISVTVTERADEVTVAGLATGQWRSESTSRSRETPPFTAVLDDHMSIGSARQRVDHYFGTVVPISDVSFDLELESTRPFVIGSAPIGGISVSSPLWSQPGPAHTEPGMSLQFDRQGTVLERVLSSTTNDGTPPAPPSWNGYGQPMSLQASPEPIQPVHVAVSGAIGLLAAAAYLAWPFLKNGVIAGIFQRRETVELHPKRQAIVQVIEENPGIHYRELHRQTGIGKGSLEHHLQVLGRQGTIRPRRDSGFTSYFAGSARAAWQPKSQAARDLVAQIGRSPGTSMADLARETGLAANNVAYHIEQLENHGRVRSIKIGRSRKVWPAAQ